MQGTVAGGKGWATSCPGAAGGLQGLSGAGQWFSSAGSWGWLSETDSTLWKWVSPETRCQWHQAGTQLNALPAGFVDVAEIRMCNLLSNWDAEEFIPGYSHRVTPP